VLTGAGHAPEMAMLHAADPGVLIAADQVLPRISPYVGVHASEPEGDPLGEFLASNAGLLDLPEDVLVLPSHGEPFRGLHARVAALGAHHDERLALLGAACAARPLTGYEAARALFARELDHGQLGFAVGEALAHVNRLLRSGALRVAGDAGGVPRYGAVG
jgi:glyoxylase-like metal-dependent hydrolase (beta-lactamase superfamily II)